MLKGLSTLALSLTEMVAIMANALNNGESLSEVDNLSLFTLWTAIDSELTERAEPESVTLPAEDAGDEEEDEEDGFGFVHNPEELSLVSVLRNYGGL